MAPQGKDQLTLTDSAEIRLGDELRLRIHAEVSDVQILRRGCEKGGRGGRIDYGHDIL